MVCQNVAIIKQGTVIASAPIKELLAQGNQLQVRVSDIQQASATLAGLTWLKIAKQEGDYLTLDVPPDRGADVNRALAERGIYASEIISQTKSLENVFLELTGGASGD